jgi:N-acetylmuramoyl-L-alanine amidase
MSLNTMLMCLALNVYHEAAYEPTLGQYAVALVTTNRARERELNVCEVVFERRQFSWANHAMDQDGKLRREFFPSKSNKRWLQAREVARQVLSRQTGDFTGGALFYHADYIAPPPWAAEKKFVAKYGRHLFYR